VYMLDISSVFLLQYLVILLTIKSKEIFCRQQHPGPVIGIIECPKLQAIKAAVRALDDFPCVTIPSNARDNNYQVQNAQRPLHFIPFVLPLVLLTCLSRLSVGKQQLVEQVCSVVLHQPNGSMNGFHSLDMHM
jgi:hypothetical protein